MKGLGLETTMDDLKGLKQIVGLMLLVGMLLLPASASAMYLLNSQKEIDLVIEQGGSSDFILMLFDTESSDVLVPDGDIEEWITFGEGRLAVYECGNREIDGVRVNVEVPSGTDAGEYTGVIGIVSGGDYSEIAVSVRVVPTMNEIKDLQGLVAINEGLQEAVENTSGELNNTKDELNEKIGEISKYQQNLTALEAELTGLKEKSTELEKENIQLTGQVVSGYSAQFVGGIVVGIVIIILLAYRASIGRALRRAKRPNVRGGGGYRGWKPS